MNAQQFDTCPHASVVNQQANNGQHNENDEFATSAHSLFVRKHIAHRSDVIEHHRCRERYGCAHQVVNAEKLRQKSKQAVIDHERNHANHAELHELRKKLFHS